MQEIGECKYCGKRGIEGDVCEDCYREDVEEKKREYIR